MYTRSSTIREGIRGRDPLDRDDLEKRALPDRDPLWTEKRFWKHYLPSTSLAGGYNGFFLQIPCIYISFFTNLKRTEIEINLLEEHADYFLTDL